MLGIFLGFATGVAISGVYNHRTRKDEPEYSGVKVVLNTNFDKERFIITPQPMKLIEEIQSNPDDWIRKQGWSGQLVRLIPVYAESEERDYPRIYKIARHMKLDTDKKTYSELCQLIDTHIKYAPDPINDGYQQTKLQFEERQKGDE